MEIGDYDWRTVVNPQEVHHITIAAVAEHILQFIASHRRPHVTKTGIFAHYIGTIKSFVRKISSRTNLFRELLNALNPSQLVRFPTETTKNMVVR